MTSSSATTHGRQPGDRGLVLVTGGGRGIGAAICRRLARDGYDVVVGYRADADSAARVVADVEEAGGRAHAVGGDLTDPAEVDRVFARVDEIGPLRALVNNSGAVRAVGHLVDADPEDLRRDLEVNLLAPVLCARRAIRSLVQGGAIVQISSVAATLGSPGTYVHYAAAKAGTDALTVGLSKELAERGIRVNTVAPGTIWTDFHQDPQRPARVAPTVPLGRAGQPEEVAGAVVWLLGEDAGYVTGATIRVSGGL